MTELKPTQNLTVAFAPSLIAGLWMLFLGILMIGWALQRRGLAGRVCRFACAHRAMNMFRKRE